MMGHSVKFFASGNETSLKWIDTNSDVSAFVTEVKSQMTAAHESPAAPAAGSSPDIADQIRKLADLRSEGLVTDEEYEAKRSELLARL
jgi:Short C-terminal domain